MATDIEPFVSALRDLSDTLDHEGIDWAVAGAVAANNYRDATRTTTDLDVILALAGNDISDVQDALHQRGWTTIAVAGDSLLRVGHPEAGRLDLMVSGTDYETGAIATAHPVEHDERLSFKTLAVEDVVILKLIAGRMQDGADIESILVAQPHFDHEYMAGWFEEFVHLSLGERFKRIEANAVERGLLRKRTVRKSDLPDH
ncbi:MAG: hypothetical protein OXH68_20570 [Gammaproteobacteria bacterium]|nr:hypothetical protein [Gammaproteobacteria bacterium]